MYGKCYKQRGHSGGTCIYITGYFINRSSSGLWNYETRQADSFLNEQDTS